MPQTTIQCFGSTYIDGEHKTSDFSSATKLRTNYRFLSYTKGSTWIGDARAAILCFYKPNSLKYKRITSVSLTFYYYIEHYNPDMVRFISNMTGGAYASSALPSQINFSNYQSVGTLATLPVAADEIFLFGTSTRTVDVTNEFQNNIVEGQFNYLIAGLSYQETSSGVQVPGDIYVYGASSMYPAYLTVNYEDVEQPSPTPTYPRDVHIREADSTLFTWQFNSSTEAYQSSAVLEYKLSSADSYTTVNITGSSHSYTLASRLSPGLYYWRVKATNDAGEVSPYSEVAQFTVYGKPQAPIINNPDNKALTTITWNAEEQNAFDIVITDSEGNVIIEDSKADTASSYKPNVFLKGAYTVGIRTKSTADLWSEWSFKAFTIDATAPAAVNLGTRIDGATVYVIYNIPDNVNAVLMRSKSGEAAQPIARLIGQGEYADKTAASNTMYVYFIRTYSDGYTDGATRTIKIHIPGTLLRSSEEEILLNKSEEKYFTHQETLSRETSVMSFSGREYPLIERGEYTQQYIGKRFFIPFTQKPIIDRMAKESSLFYRDNVGNAYKVAIVSLQYNEYENNGYIASFELVRIDEEELIVNV